MGGVLAAVPQHLGCLGVFADDLGLAACDLLSAMFALDPMFCDVAFGANLHI